MQLRSNFLAKCFFCGCLGILCSLSFAPFSLWFLAILAQCTLIFILYPLNALRAFACLWSFWALHQTTGAYWIYTSLSGLLGINAYQAVALTCVIGIFYALVLMIPWLLFVLSPAKSGLRLALFPAAWIACEWLQYSILGGLPWVVTGYAFHATWLSGWVPVFGVLGASFIICCSSVFLYQLLSQREEIWRPLSGLALAWLGGLVLSYLTWTTAYGTPIPVTLVQPEAKGWLERAYTKEERDEIWNQEIAELSLESWKKGLLVWPEHGIRALPEKYERIHKAINEQAKSSSTALISGANFYTVTDEIITSFNSVFGIGKASGIYHKQKLAPIGERDPLDGFNTFFGKNRDQFPGKPATVEVPELISFTYLTEKYAAAASICYEVTWGNYLQSYAMDANILINLSNDRWFRNSAQLEQALNMAQIRALEHQKPMLRSTFGGISAHIDYRGDIIKRAKDSSATTIESMIQPRQGQTPYAQFGDLPILLLSVIGPIWIFLRRRDNAAHSATSDVKAG